MTAPKKLSPNHWLSLRITEEGGFTGISRSAHIAAADLSLLEQQRWGHWLTQLQQTALPLQTVGADFQTVRLQCDSGNSRWEACFNSADLPESLAQMMSKISLRP